MNATIKTLSAATVLAIVWAASPRAAAQAEDPQGYGDGYQSGQYGRIRDAENGATIVRADAARSESDPAGVNAPVFPGDAVRSDGAQRVEVQLADGSLVRLDRGTGILFQSLPDPYAKFQDNTVLVLDRGAIRVVSHVTDKQEFRVDTRDASIYLLGDGDFRIDADERGGTRVASLRGVAEVVGNDGSVLVRGGTRTAVFAGSEPETPRSYSAFGQDGFDRWCASRDDAYRARDRVASADGGYDDVPSEVQPYYGELEMHGSWTVVPEYGRVWYPTGVAAGWRPYSDGYWGYGPGGYFWISAEPWGWAPYHYGSWQYVSRYGWCWAPGSVFGGAWVSWSWGSLYVGWAPLDYWGRAAWMGGPYHHGYYDPGCWTFVDYGHISGHNARRYAVPIGTVGDDLRHATVVARAPRVDPKRIATSKEARDRALHQVAQDRPARMRPIDAGKTPDRRLGDMQDRLTKRTPTRPPAVTPPARGGVGDRVPRERAIDTKNPQRGTTAPRIQVGGAAPQASQAPQARSRRLTEDPRQPSRVERPRTPSHPSPDARRDVRDLYERMSRPRETRERQDTASRPAPRRESAASAQAPRPPARREAASAPRPGSPTRAQAPKTNTPAPRVAPKAPPRPAPKATPKPAPKAKPPRGKSR